MDLHPNLKTWGEKLRQSFRQRTPVQVSGRVTRSVGMTFEASCQRAAVGSLASVQFPDGSEKDAEVIGFRGNQAVLMSLDDLNGIHTDCFVKIRDAVEKVRVGSALLGRILNAKGEPMDGKGPIDFRAGDDSQECEVVQAAAHPMKRTVIEKPLDLGVRAINALLTIGKGQRVGIFAGSGVGKSVLLGMMAKRTEADVNVIALIGERGREVREFIERDLGPEGLKRSVVIVATSDQSPLLRAKGAVLAATVAEYFRDVQSKDVLLLMDSVTRFSMARREIGLSLGEPPATKGYPPSVFASLAKLLERSGTGVNGGSITALYTVLVEGDDLDDPIADSARSILDGHIVLSRKIAQKNHFPAIDVLQSVSRVMNTVISPEHRAVAGKIKEWMAVYNQAEDLVQLGAYVKGTSVKIDQAISANDRIQAMLRQAVDDQPQWDEAFQQMFSIVRSVEA